MPERPLGKQRNEAAEKQFPHILIEAHQGQQM